MRDWLQPKSDLSCLYTEPRHHDKSVNPSTTLFSQFDANILTAAPVGNCGYIRQISILYPFTIPLTIVPFVMRVFALYNNNKYVVTFFSVTWLSVLGSCIAVPMGARGFNIGTTKYCLDGKTKLANALALFCPFIHDSLVFLATSWALMRCSYDNVNGITNDIRVMVLGRHLPAFSKSILRDGQFYYLWVQICRLIIVTHEPSRITLILNLFFIVLFYKPQATITPCTIGIVVFVMLNTMSSYVYRNMRFGYYRDYSVTSSIINDALQRPGQSSRSHREIVFKNSTATKSLDTGVSQADSEGKVDELVGGMGKTDV